MKFVIDTKKWRTGSEGSNKTGEGNTLLLNKEGFMCCLGMCLQQIGVDDVDLFGELTPASVKSNLDAMKIFRNGFLFEPSNSFAKEAIRINDKESTTVDEKKEKLIELFAKNGHEIEFI